MRKFGRFLRDAGTFGLTSMLAAGVSTAVGVWDHFHDKSVSGYIFFVLSLLLFYLGAFLAWSKKDSELSSEIAKRVRPDLTASFLAVGFGVMLRLQNSSSSPAVGIRLTDIHHHGKVLLFHPPETVTSLAGGLINSEILESEQGRDNVCALFTTADGIREIHKGSLRSETLTIRITFSNLDSKAMQKTWVLVFDFYFDYKQNRLICGTQTVESL
jgi:hypothetical protein